MKKKIGLSTVFIVLLIVGGVGILFYPKISMWFNNRLFQIEVNEYDNAIRNVDEETIEYEAERAREYNRNLSRYLVSDPFAASVNGDTDATYGSILNINGIIGVIQIPKIDVNLPIYHGTSRDTLQKGIGHFYGTHLPIGGDGTHAVMTGHTGLPNAELFTDLDQLEIGDSFQIQVLDEILYYQVDQVKVVEPENVSDLAVVKGMDYLTLVTCTPYGVNSHRLLVRGVRSAPPMGTEAIITQTSSMMDKILELWWLWLIVIGICLFIIWLLLLYKSKQKERGKKQ